MEQQTMEQEIMRQILELMDKSGLDLIPPTGESSEFVEAMVINLKTLNAKYDKNEAIYQIKCLMDKYNIQLDQLIDQRGIV